MSRQDEIIASIRQIKAERSTALQERANALLDRDTIKAKLDGVKGLLASDGDGLSLTKLPSFLKSLRELLGDAKE